MTQAEYYSEWPGKAAKRIHDILMRRVVPR
jgi:hypothetical protein